MLVLLVVGLGSFAVGLMLQFASGPKDDAPASNPQAAPFLGGGNMETHAWQRFHLRYYSMVLLFIAFEMEMMFMYPWAVVFLEEGAKALIEMGMFLAILSVGIIYAWREGVFRWQ
jgi:NADH:ubiquinone oxidoreductase subunit 3 (subunit A)